MKGKNIKSEILSSKIKSNLDVTIIKCIFSILIGLFLFTSPSKGNNKPKQNALFINSINFESKWTHNLYKNLKTHLLTQNIVLDAEELSVPALSSMQQVDSLLESLKEKHPTPPYFIVFVGDPGFIVCQSLLQSTWKNTPVIICHTKKKSPCSIETLISKTPLNAFNSQPTQKWIEKNNATGLRGDVEIKKTVSLMKDLLPNMKQIAFISDDRLISMMARKEMEEAMKTHFPEIALIQLSSRDVTTEELMDAVSRYDQTTGVIFYSWFVSGLHTQHTYLKDNIQRIISSITPTPIFVINDLLYQQDEFAGGCYETTSTTNNRALKLIDQIIAGTPANEIPIDTSSTSSTILNYGYLIKHGISPKLFPKDAIFINQPPSFFETNKMEIFSGAIILVLFIIILFMRMHYLAKRKEQQEQENVTLLKYRKIIENMPILYFQKRRILDENNNLIDFEITDVNKNFETSFGIDPQFIIGKKITELLTDKELQQALLSENDYDTLKPLEIPVLLTGGRSYETLSFLGESNDFVSTFCLDRTEIMQAQRKTDEISELNQRIINSLHDPVCFVDSKGIIVSILNRPQHSALYNRIKENDSIFSLFNSADNDVDIITVINNVIAEKATDSVQINFIKADEVLSFLLQIVYFDENKVLIIFQDISEVEQERLMSEKYRLFLESVLDQLPVAATVKDMNNNLSYIYWNKMATETFGYTFEEVQSIANRSIIPGYTQFIELDKGISAETPTISTAIEVNFGNVKKHLLTYKSICNFKSGQKWLLSTFQDITEMQRNRKELQVLNDRYKLVLEATQLNAWNYDLATKRTPLENRDDEFLARVKRVSEYVVRKIHPDDQTRVMADLYQLLRGEIEVFKDEYRMLSDNGYLWMETHAIVYNHDERNLPILLVGASLCTHERKTMEIELVKAKEKADESNRLKSAFLANMSHEIRTPLNAIVGFSGLVASAENDEEREQYVEIIENNNTLLLQLINDILDLSKIEAGTLDFTDGEIELSDMLEQLEQSTQLRNKEQSIQIVLDNIESPCHIIGDKYRLMQVLNNFLSNAMKFTEVGEIRFGYKIGNEKAIYFYVTDTGCGIPIEKHSAIFDRFTKLNTFTQGTGLGLSICKTIVEKMNGTIGIDSKPEGGSTFWFKIPLRAAHK